jgi:predicted nucleic acid-binding protein
MKKKSTPVDLSDIFLVRSDKLVELKAVIETWTDLQGILVGLQRFRLVVDTNVILGDLLWLVCERTNANAKTHLMETVEAGTIDLFAPPAFFEEVEEKIPLLAIQQGVDAALMYLEWEIYKRIIQVAIPDEDKVLALRAGVDPDDADFIALAQSIGAAGVISKDRHIKMMGGNQISVECVTYLRNYSRATAIELNIKVNGIQFVIGSNAAIREFSAFVAETMDRIRSSPPWVKVGLLAVGLYIVLNPKARAGAGKILRTLLSGVGEATPAALALMVQAAAHAQTNEVAAKVHLDKAMKELARGASSSQIGCPPR